MKVTQVNDLRKVDRTRYVDGDLFISGEKVSMLVNGKMKPLFKEVNTKDFIKKSELDAYLKKEYPQLFEEKEGK